jgi:hypothetical protein
VSEAMLPESELEIALGLVGGAVAGKAIQALVKKYEILGLPVSEAVERAVKEWKGSNPSAALAGKGVKPGVFIPENTTTINKPLIGTNNHSVQVVAEYSPLNQGPLPLDVANTFRSGSYSEIVTREPVVLYRVYGGAAGELGQYWTTVTPTGPVQSIVDSALNPAWGNTATNIIKIEVPSGVTFY